ncbi:MAG: hypothetical protein PHE25_05630, partial [Candidatus Gracilibacteria bacterium]|nr:hypothetical protein [Candidatus Gracilibacteria bacterium]
MNYLQIRGQVNINNKIDNFLEFFNLVTWSKKDKLNYFYANFYNYLEFFELAGNKELEKQDIQEFFTNNEHLKHREEELDKLLKSNKITQEDYNNAIGYYNEFVLQISIFKTYSSLEAK